MLCLEDGIPCGTLTPSTFSYLSAAHNKDVQQLDYPGCILGDTSVLCWAQQSLPEANSMSTTCPWATVELHFSGPFRYKNHYHSWHLDLTLVLMSEIAGLNSSFSSYELNSGHILQASEGHMFAPAGKNGFWSTTKLACTMRVVRTQETRKWSCYYIYTPNTCCIWQVGGGGGKTNLKAKPMN